MPCVLTCLNARGLGARSLMLYTFKGLAFLQNVEGRNIAEVNCACWKQDHVFEPGHNHCFFQDTNLVCF